MSNFLTQNYVDWLTRYKSQNDDHSVQLIAGKLITKLPKAKSINQVISLLEEYIPTEKTTLYGTINFFAQLSTWKTELGNIRAGCSNALQVLQNINNDHPLYPLIRILHEQITEPKLQLHYRIQSLLAIICSEQFPNTLKYLEHLEKVPRPKSPPKGSFAAIIPLNTDHAFCLALLNNLSAKPDQSNELWSQSNGFLQSSLLIYQDMELVEVSLEDQKHIDMRMGSLGMSVKDEKKTDINQEECGVCVLI